jgi:hypothetical protein
MLGTYQYQGEWRTVQLQSKEHVIEAIHSFPVEAFSHVLDRDASCMCGPALTMVENNDADPRTFLTYVQHTVLDAYQGHQRDLSGFLTHLSEESLEGILEEIEDMLDDDD